MKIYITLILAFILNFYSVNLFAQNTWQDVGPNNGFSEGNALFTKIASDSKNELFVAYQDVTNNGITVKRFEQANNSWVTIGTPGFSGAQVSKISLVINQDTLYVSYMASGGAIVVQKFNGTAWQILGGVITSQGDFPSLAFNPTNNSPYIVFSTPTNSNKGVMKKYDKSSNSWLFVNTTNNNYSLTGAYFNSLAFKTDGTPMVAFKDDLSFINVQSYYGGSWVNIGTPSFASGVTSDITLKFNSYNYSPYVAFKDVNSKASVYNCQASLWNLVGLASFTNPISNLSLAFDGGGKPFIAFGDQGNSSKINVMNYGSSWVNVGAAFSNGGVDFSDIIIQNNTPFVVFPDNGFTQKAVVKKFSNCVQNIPSIAGNNLMYCIGSTANSLTATPNAGYSLQWWGNNPIGGTPIAASITPDISTVGLKSYFVSQTDGSGCNTARAQIDINTVNKPTATITSSNTAICSGNTGTATITLTGNLPFNFSYYDNGNFINIPNHNLFTYTINTPTLNTDREYKLNSISDNLCNGGIINNSVIFSVTTPQVASFTYPNSTYCKNTTNPSAVLNAGSTAGTFSSTAGLAFINIATGKIDLVNSNPGTYIIKNTIAPSGGCGQVVDQFTITIIAAPSINTPPVNANICIGGSNNFSLSASGGSSLTYQWMYSNDGTTYSGLTNGTPTGASYTNTTTSTLSVSGVTVTGPNHYYKCIVNDVSSGCNSVAASATLTVNAPPIATFSYTGTPYCANAANPLPTFSSGGVAGTFSSTSGLNFVNASTGQINLTTSTPGTYTVKNTISVAGCTNAIDSSSITISKVPEATFTYAGSPYCKSGTNPTPTLGSGADLGTFTSSSGLVFVNNNTGEINLSTSTPGEYNIINAVSSIGCFTDVKNNTITINSLPTSTLEGTAAICNGANTNLSVALTGSQPWNITYTDGTTPVTISGITTSPYLISVSPVTAKTYSITAVSDANCSGTSSGTANITVTTAPVANFNYTGTPYCSNVSNPSPKFYGGGIAGTFSSTTGLQFVDATTGQVNLLTSTPGNYTVTNTITASGGCPTVVSTSGITIKKMPVGTFDFNNPSPICSNETNPYPVYSNGGIAGVFSALPSGLNFVNTATGELDLVNTLPGSYTIYNTIEASGGCIQSTFSRNIIITSLPIATFSYTNTPYCKNVANPLPTFIGGGIAGTFSSTSGLLFVSTATGQVNLLTSTPGNYNITNTISASGGCAQVVANSSINITAPPVAILSGDATICAGTNTDLKFDLTGNFPLRVIYTDGIINDTISNIDASQFIKSVNPSSSKNYTIISVTDGACEGSFTGNANVTVNQLPTSTISGDTTICNGGISKFYMNFTGKAPFDIIYHDGVSLFDAINNINANSKEVATMPSITTKYTVTSIKDANNCIGNIFNGSATATVNQLPTGTISGNATICKGSSTLVTVNLTGLGPWGIEVFDQNNNKTLSFPIFSSPYSINLTPTESNTYSLKKITDINQCKYIGTGLPNEIVNVIIKELPTAIISGDTTICSGQITPLKVTFTGTGPWDFSYDGNPVINTLTNPYSFNVNSVANKTYRLTNVSSGGCVGTASGSAIITTRSKPNPISFQDSFTSTCKGKILNPYINTTSGSNYKWFVNNALSAGNFNFSYQFNQLGNNTINVVETDKFGCIGDTISKNIIVEDYPLAPATSNLTYCQNETSNPLTATINANCVDKWYNALTGGIALGTVPTPNTTTNGITSYFVSQKTSLAGCESPRTQLDVTIKKSPTVSFTGNQTIVEGNAADITITLDGTAPWNLTYLEGTTSKVVSNINLGYVLTVNPTITTTYKPTQITDASGCTGNIPIGSITITVTPNVVITQQPINSSVCEGLNTSFEVIATNANNYKWQVKHYGTSTFVDITNPSIYSGINTNKLMITGVINSMNQDTYQCIVNGITSNEGLLTIHPKPSVTFSGTTTICEGNNTDLKFDLTGTPPFNVTYNDYLNSDINISNISELSKTINVSPTNTTSYQIINLSDANCSGGTFTGNPQINVTQKPKADFKYSDTIYCQSASNPIAQLINGGIKGTFSCTDPNLKFSNNSTGEIDLIQSLIGDYVITNTISAANGCAMIAYNVNKISIESSQGRKTQPELETIGSYTNCTTNSFAIRVKNDEPLATYQWFRNGRMIVGATNDTISLATYGNYSVNDNSCLPSSKITINATSFGTVPIITSNGIGTNSATLNSNNITGTYQWYINDYLILGENQQTLNISFNGTYKLGVNNNGCTIFSEVFNVNDPLYPNARATMQFNSDSSVSLKHDLVNGYNIVPNPSNGAIHIIGNNMTLSYKIIIKNIEGANIYEHENILSTNSEHNIADFPTGIYIVELIIDNNSYISKLVKN